MSALNMAILLTIVAVCKKYKKRYCFISQGKFLELLERFYEMGPCRRTLNYHLSALEQLGYLKRIGRTERLPDGTFRRLATMYQLGARAYYLLKGIVRNVTAFFRATKVQFLAHNDSLRSVIYTSRSIVKQKRKTNFPDSGPFEGLTKKIPSLNERERISQLKNQAQALLNRSAIA